MNVVETSCLLLKEGPQVVLESLIKVRNGIVMKNIAAPPIVFLSVNECKSETKRMSPTQEVHVL